MDKKDAYLGKRKKISKENALLKKKKEPRLVKSDRGTTEVAQLREGEGFERGGRRGEENSKGLKRLGAGENDTKKMCSNGAKVVPVHRLPRYKGKAGSKKKNRGTRQKRPFLRLKRFEQKGVCQNVQIPQKKKKGQPEGKSDHRSPKD